MPNRLSATASAKLTDNNPNIADLSDENRPTKLSEQFSELYDNEWTDAIETLTGTESNVENEKCGCNKLLKVVTVSNFISLFYINCLNITFLKSRSFLFHKR